MALLHRRALLPGQFRQFQTLGVRVTAPLHSRALLLAHRVGSLWRVTVAVPAVQQALRECHRVG